MADYLDKDGLDTLIENIKSKDDDLSTKINDVEQSSLAGVTVNGTLAEVKDRIAEINVIEGTGSGGAPIEHIAVNSVNQPIIDKTVDLEIDKATYEEETKTIILGDTTKDLEPIACIKVNGEAQSIEDSTVDISIPTKTSELENDSGFVTDADIPTKTSELENDSGFITDADIPTRTSQLKNDSDFVTSYDVPTKTSELENDSGFVTDADISDIANIQDTISSLQYEISANREVSNYTYEGVDLTAKFSDEIRENYEDEWQWIKARIDNGDWSGLRNGDYIPLTLNNGETYEMQINIDPYYIPNHYSQYFSKHHIDFISNLLFSEKIYQWNENNTNNGTDSGSPYLDSTIYQELNNDLYGYLPDNVKELISDKMANVELRRSSAGTLTDSAGSSTRNIGKIWLLSEFEVFGATLCATPRYDAIDAIQYPIFAHNYMTRNKGYLPFEYEDSCSWWLRSVASGNSTNACCVSNTGFAMSNYANADDTMVPICFRIAAS